MTTKLRIIPLGGLGEIGKNMLAIEYGNDILVIDAGVMFPEEDMLGVDLVIPDTSYLVARKDKVRAILITHGHEDHIGALPYLLDQIDAPVYASRLTLGLIRVRLRELRRLANAKMHEITPSERFKLGHLSAEFFRVCHSIPDAMGIAIRTPLGIVIHTGDFKFDHTPVDGLGSDLGKLASFGAEGVLLLLSDSTYAELPGYTPSEQVVGQTLMRVVGQAPGRVVVTTFASLISRIQQVVDAAGTHGRKVAVVGRSMQDNVQMAMKLGYLSAPSGTIVRIDELKQLPPERAVIVTTGSQGEPTSALVRMANEDHKEVSIIPGDTVVISATPIPGNETLVYKTINNLMRLGARVLYDKIDQVHVHGHAAQEELKTMLSLTRPRFFVPIHGEYRHLATHVAIAQTMGIPKENAFLLEDGDVLELTSESAARAGRVNAGPIYVDGLARWDMDTVVLRDRKTLSRDGIVVAFVAVDEQTCRIVGEPEVVTYGFVEEREAAEIVSKAKDLIVASLSAAAHRAEVGFLHQKLKESLGQHFFNATKRRPLILPVVVQV